MITAMPDVRKEKITADAQFLIIACDGIWDCLTSQEAVDFVG
jgi:protein phosphatase 1G